MLSCTRHGLVAGLVAAVAAALPAGAGAAFPGVPSIYVNYNPDCTFSMYVDGGITIGAGAPATLPPGQYQLLVTMPNPSTGYPCTTPTFSLTGPGVNLQTVFPNQAINTDQLLTLSPSSTYVAEEQTNPAATQVSFTTSATGSSSSLLSGTPGASLPSTTSSQSDLVGSAAGAATVVSRGVLDASVSKTGRPMLTRSGRSVTTLAAGRYEIAVDITARHSALDARRGTAKATTLAPSGFVGKRTVTVILTAGAWSFYTSAADPTRVTVVG